MKKNTFVIFILIVLLLTASLTFANSENTESVKYGFWSVIPPLLAIVLAFITKEVILSLLIGVFSGAVINVFATSNSNFFYENNRKLYENF